MNQIIRSSRIVYLIASIVTLVSITSCSYTSRSGECPPTDCDSTPVGSKAFVLDLSPYSYKYLNTGDVYPTTEGRLIQITGSSNSYYEEEASFLVAPSTLPAPEHGIKGTFYFLSGGDISYANYL